MVGGIGGLRDPKQPVTFQVDAGYAIDGTAFSANPTLETHKFGANDVALTRAFGFGDAYLGTRGVGIEPLQTFISTRVELTTTLLEPSNHDLALAAPIPTWFTANNAMIRSAWGELHDLSDQPWLSPLRLRAGELYVYGPWVMHLRGAQAAWEGKIITLRAYAGQRAPDYSSYNPFAIGVGTVAGGSARIDLRDLIHIPVSFAADEMQVTSVDGTPTTHHTSIEADWRPNRDTVLLGEARWLDGEFANGHAQLRARYHQQTNLVFDVVGRTSADWQWDPSLTQLDAVGEARRYLDLGPVVPQVVASVRAGTVVFDNLDLLARGAGAFELETGSYPRTAWTQPYAEVAGAAELRLRRTVTLGASALTRTLTSAEDTAQNRVIDVAGSTQPLPLTAAIGQKSFVELGTSARLSLGARRFSAMVEVYGRRTRYAQDYCTAQDANATMCIEPTEDSKLITSDLRIGGRVSADAWINKNLRFLVTYELSSAIAIEPEITGYRSLRILVEGVY